MKQPITLFFVLVIISTVAAAYFGTENKVIESKRQHGCASYGHSCYGGHGKRSINIPNKFARMLDPDENPTNDSVELLLKRYIQNLATKAVNNEYGDEN